MLAKPAHATGISGVSELGISLGCFVNGQGELSVRLWPLVTGQGRTWLVIVRMGIHGVSVTRLDAQLAGYPQTAALKILEGKPGPRFPRCDGRAHLVNVLELV